MSDLISRSALIELIQKDIEKTASFMNTAKKYDGSFDKLYGQLNTLKNYKSIISDSPTVFDVEKVVAELEKMRNEDSQGCKDVVGRKCFSYIDCGLCIMDRAIDIVRKGGAE